MTNRVAGHTLAHEGAPYNSKTGQRITWHGTAGRGCARCSCGAFSPVLDSGTKRRAWHREHKANVARGSRG
jgi:hypothetical protein